MLRFRPSSPRRTGPPGSPPASQRASATNASRAHHLAVELAVLAVQPVTADHRHVAARHVAAADLDHDRRALLDPAPALGRGLGGLEVEQRAHRLAERRQPAPVRPATPCNSRPTPHPRARRAASARSRSATARSRGGTRRPSSSPWTMITPPIIRVDTPQLVVLRQFELAARRSGSGCSARCAKLVPRKCQVPAWSALPSCIIASIQ